MKHRERIRRFAADEDGAVTVDWVVLTAAIVGLGMAVLMTVGNGVTDLAGNVATTVTATETGLWTGDTASTQ